jgi:RHS repeat-associated protein
MSRTILGLFAALAFVSEAFAQPVDTTFTVYGPCKFERAGGSSTTITDNFTLPQGASSPFTMDITNGEAKGSRRVSGAEIKLNSAIVVQSSEIGSSVPSLTRTVSLTQRNTLEVRLTGSSHSFVSIRLTATDRTPPQLTLSSPTNNLVTNKSKIVVSGDVEDATAVRVTVNGTDVSVKHKGKFGTHLKLSQGQNTITIVAQDAGGNTTTAMRIVYRDNTPPALTVSEPANGFVTKSASVVVRGTAVDPPNGSTSSKVTVKVDGKTTPVDGSGAFSGTVKLREGKNSITIVATDAAGNESREKRNVIRDTKPPKLVVRTPGDKMTTGDSSVTVCGTVSDKTVATLTLSLNGGPAVSIPLRRMGSFKEKVSLVEGINTLRLTATDAAGNSTVVMRAVTRRITSLTLVVGTPEDETITTASSITVAGTVKGVGRVSLTVNGTPAEAGTDGSFSTSVALEEGSNVVTVRATDGAKNTSTVQRLVIRDTTPPSLAITDPEEGYVTKEPTVTISGTVEDSTSVAVSVNGTPATVEENGDFTAPVSLTEGVNAIAVTATDTAGNASTLTWKVRKDTTPPLLTISQPAEGAITAADSILVAGVVTDPPVLAGLTVTLEDVPVSVEADGSFSGYLELPAQGAFSFTVVATDTVGNSTTLTRTIIYDSAPPVVSDLFPADNSLITADSTLTVSALVTDLNGFTVTINGIQATITPEGRAGAAVVLAEGENTITIVATDELGNTITVTRTVIRDSTPPVVTVSQPSTGAITKETEISVVVTIEDSTETEVKANGVLLVQDDSGDYTGEVSLAEGENTITIVATDIVGNSATLTRSVIRDTAPPVLTVAQPVDSLTTGQSMIAVEGSASDSTAFSLKVNGRSVPVGPDGSWATEDTLVEGWNSITIEAVDTVGNTATVVRHVQRSSLPPALTLFSPMEGAVLSADSVLISGKITSTSTVTLTINGAGKTVKPDGSFSGKMPIVEGQNHFVLIATDALGQKDTSEVSVVRDTKQPSISIISPAFTPYTTDSTIVIIGSVVDSSGTTVSVNGIYQQLSGIGGFETELNLVHGVNTFTIQATDLAGNTSTTVRTIQRVQKVSDPATVAPVVDRTVTTTVASATEFLYTGTNAVQKNVAAGTINALRVTALRGKVVTQQGLPLSGVTVKVLNHTEYGFTLTREDGMYDLAVNGGAAIALDYARPGYLPAQRTVGAEWQTYGHVDDVAIVAMDTLVQHVDFTAPQGVQATPVVDELGARRPTVFFPQGTVASLVFPTFSYRTILGCTGVPPKILSTPVDSLVAINGINIRVQEYSIGADGEQALPAPLPSVVTYSFAFELQADEVISRGAASAQLSQPATLLLENVINFPEGMSIPLGFYDRARAAWLPVDNGQVIRIVSKDIRQEDGGQAVYAGIDWNGDGVAEHPDTLVLRGISYAEQRYLATTYSSTQSLLRMKFSKLGSYAIGFGFVLPTNAKGPSNPAPDRYAKVDRDNILAGSVIGVQNQMLGESIPIVNTSLSLHYRSDRVEGRREAYMLDIPLTGSPAPDSVLRVEVEVEVAGQVTRQTYSPQANLKFQYEWDGKDVYGRKLQGQQNVLTTISYYYATRYAIPADWSKSFATPTGSNMIRYIPSRKEMAKTQIWEGKIGAFDMVSLGIGGWSISQHHGFDVLGRTLHTGDGQVRSAKVMDNVINTIAGVQPWRNLFNCDPQFSMPLPGTQIPVNSCSGFCFTDDGSLLMSETNKLRKIDAAGILSTVAGLKGGCGSNYPDTTTGILADCASLGVFDVAVGLDKSIYLSRGEHIYRITPDGEMTLYAGVYYNTGSNGYLCYAAGDGGPAIDAHFGRISQIQFGKDGCLYIGDMFNNRIRKISPDGIVTTVAGGAKNYYEGGYSGDGGPAIKATMYEIRGFALGPDGSLFIADYRNHRIRKVTPDGIIRTIAGTGIGGLTGDGGLGIYARVSYPFAMTVGDDGTAYFIQNAPSGKAVRAISPDGYIKTVMGNGSTTWLENGPATAALTMYPGDVQFGPDGDLVVSDDPGSYIAKRIVRVGPPLPGLKLSEILVASEDGSEQYVFTYGGRHLRTLDALTGVTKYTFNYDSANRLVSIVDVDSLVTTIERDTSGKATAIISPYGVRTQLVLDANGYLLQAINPANESRQFTYTDKGLMTSMTDARGSMYTYTYDSLGYLTKDLDPVGGFTAISRVNDSTGYTVTATTAMGKVTKYRVDQLRDGTKQFTTTDPNGLKTTTSDATNGTATSTAPNGMQTPVEQKPDPRYGMQSPLGSVNLNTPSGLKSNVNQIRKVTQMSGTQVTALTDSIIVNGKSYRTEWDGVQHRLIETSAEGRKRFIYLDKKGKIIKDSTSGLAALTICYDSKGRKIESRQIERRTLFEYDNLGRQSRLIDPYGRSTYFYYDSADRLVKTVGPDSSEILFTYDRNGNVTSVTPFGKPSHSFEYSLVDLEMSYAPPFTGDSARSTTKTYTLDKESHKVLRPDSLNITMEYGGTGSLAGQPRRILFDRGAITNLYDTTKGLHIGAVAPNGDSVKYVYDGALLKRITWTGSVKGNVVLSYNTDLQVSTETVLPVVGKADSINMNYDKDGLITMVGALKLRYRFDNALLLSDTLGGIITNYTYSLAGELLSKETRYGSTTLFKIEFNRDSLGRITHQVESNEGVVKRLGYRYDGLGRLSQVWKDDTLISAYSFDSNGNRLSHWIPTSSESGSYDQQDRIIRYGQDSYVYRSDGTLKMRANILDTTRYFFDAFANLMAVRLPDGTVVEYVLDANGLRIGKNVNGAVTRRWIYANNLRIIAELDSTNQITKRFVYATSQNVPEYFVSPSGTYRVVTDHLGSPRLVVNSSTGAIVQRINYDEYGNQLCDDNPGLTPFGYAGGLYDQHTELTQFGVRDYDPKVGRWIAKDPILFRGKDSNLFSYVENDPINNVDPKGIWTTGAHRKLISNALSNRVDAAKIEIMVQAGKGLDDRTQGQEDSYIHGMAAWGQSLEVALGQSSKFIKENLDMARYLSMAGEEWAATYFLGLSLHTITDSYSPLHRDRNGNPKALKNRLGAWQHNSLYEGVGNITEEIRSKSSIEINEAYDYVFGKR